MLPVPARGEVVKTVANAVPVEVRPEPDGPSIPGSIGPAAVLSEAATETTPHLVDFTHTVDLGPILQPLPPAPPDELVPDWLRRRQSRAHTVAADAGAADSPFALDLRRRALPSTEDYRMHPASQAGQAAPPPTLKMTAFEALVAIAPLFAGVLLLLAGVGAGTVVIPG